VGAVSHDRFRILFLVVAAVLSLATFAFWPGRVSVPAGLGGWLTRLVVTFGLPSAALAILTVFRRLRRKDPLGANFVRFQKTYDLILDAAVVLIMGLHLTLLAYLLAGRIWLGFLVPLLLGGTIAFAGNLVPRIRPNSVVGIRTPWTLFDEGVWTRTHRIAGYVIVVFGLALMATTVLSFQRTWTVIIIGTVAAVIGLPSLSYNFWRRRRGAPENHGDKSARLEEAGGEPDSMD
jgi:uncharacterized membrane protein